MPEEWIPPVKIDNVEDLWLSFKTTFNDDLSDEIIAELKTTFYGGMLALYSWTGELVKERRRSDYVQIAEDLNTFFEKDLAERHAKNSMVWSDS